MSTDIVLTASELAQRGTPYHPIRPVPAVYTHVGDAKNHGIGRRLNIRLIIDHTTEGAATSIVGSMRYDARRPELVSATAITGEDGCGYDVAEENRPYTTGRWNDESLSNETVGHAAWTADFWHDERPFTIVRKIDLFTYWCRRYAIPAVWLSASEIAEGATREGVTPFRAGIQRGICDHLEANRAAILLGGSPAKYSHHDVGAGMRQVLFDTIIPAVAARLDNAPTPPPDEEDEMPKLRRVEGSTATLIIDGSTATWVKKGDAIGPAIADGLIIDARGDDIPVAALGVLTLLGPVGDYSQEPGRNIAIDASHFAGQIV